MLFTDVQVKAYEVLFILPCLCLTGGQQLPGGQDWPGARAPNAGSNGDTCLGVLPGGGEGSGFRAEVYRSLKACCHGGYLRPQIMRLQARRVFDLGEHSDRRRGSSRLKQHGDTLCGGGWNLACQWHSIWIVPCT